MTKSSSTSSETGSEPLKWFESGRSGGTGAGALAGQLELTAHDSGLCGFASSPSPSRVLLRVQPPVEATEIWLVGEQPQEEPEDRRKDTIQSEKE